VTDTTSTVPLGRREALALAALMVLTAALLHQMGQPPWCAQGDSGLWSSAVQSAHNSQHLADPYTLTHVLHGLAFYAILQALAGGSKWGRPAWAPALESPARRFLVAMAVEAAWEVFENTDFVIERYREATISLDYYGDSIANALGDIAACAAGYLAAMALPVWGSAMSFGAVELLLLWWIRDSLLLNILMLVWPIEAIKRWQGG
jgi:hypothetical protein